MKERERERETETETGTSPTFYFQNLVPNIKKKEKVN
jgi:hypothetical protein